MVKQTLAVLIGLTALVDARPPPPPDDYHDDEPVTPSDDDAPAFNMFGFDFGFGSLPYDGASTLAMSLGLDVEHPVFKKTRVAGEYDWLWLTRSDERDVMPTAPRPERHATGHRVSLGLRRELLAGGNRKVRMFIDGELGGSIALANDNMTGMQLMPGVFTGLRLGYDMYTTRDESPSGTFETALLLRALAVRDGVGITFGVGMYWGN